MGVVGDHIIVDGGREYLSNSEAAYVFDTGILPTLLISIIFLSLILSLPCSQFYTDLIFSNNANPSLIVLVEDEVYG